MLGQNREGLALTLCLLSHFRLRPYTGDGARSDAQPGGTCGMEDHAVEHFKATKLFLERKNFRNLAVAFNLIT